MTDEAKNNATQEDGPENRVNGEHSRADTGEGQENGPRVTSGPVADGVIMLAVAALVVSGAFALHLRYAAVGSEASSAIVDTWTRTVVALDGTTVSVVPMDFNDSKTVPGGLLWGDFDDVLFGTVLEYTNGRLYYEFATQDLTPAILDAMTYGRGITFLLTSQAGVPLVVIDENFAQAVRLIDTTADNQDPVGISFSGQVPADKGVWEAIAAVRTQYQ